MKLSNTEKAINSIPSSSPMLKYLQSMKIKFNAEHNSNHLIHCENRSKDNPYSCTHGLMDLCVESWQENKVQIVSVCFYYIQNGDMMRDPDIVFKYNIDSIEPIEIPLSYRLDGMGVYDEVYVDKNVNLTLLKEIKDMLKMTVKHCKDFNYYLKNEVEEDE